MFPSQLCKVTESLIRLLAHMARSFRESCLHFRGTLRTLFTEPHKSFYNRTSIVSCRAAENEFISWLVSDFMLTAALWMLPEISRTETLIAISSTLSCMKSNYFVMFPLTSDALMIWLLQPIRRGSSSSGTLCCRLVQQFVTPGRFGSAPRAATCCVINLAHSGVIWLW